MLVELDDAARKRTIDAARIFVGMARIFTPGAPCTTFLCVEDGFTSAFHACVCDPSTLKLVRFDQGGADGDQV